MAESNPEEKKVLEERKRAYEEKVNKIFVKCVINKDLVRSFNFDLPRYIFEYLLSKFSESGKISPDKKRELFTLIEKHYPDPEQLEIYKYKIIKEDQVVNILNHFQVTLDARTEKYNVYFPFFASESKNLEISNQIVDNNKGLLMNGLWGIASIRHDALNPRPFYISEFTPFQLQEIHLDEYIQARESFSLPEWVDLLINTMGLNPNGFKTVRSKLFLIARLIPYVENNYNLIEMGPKGTGKSFLHKNISTHAHVIGGGTITRAQLFYHITKREKGLLITNDVVVFDDFSHIQIKGAEEVIGKLKNYMADGYIDVGSYKETSNSSVIIMGNLEMGRNGLPLDRFYFRSLPRPMQESAFLDRLCAFIPGWELHPIRPEDLSVSYGLIGDWFSEILHALRKKSFIPEIEDSLTFIGEKVRQRDINYMKATASGLIKLLFPNGDMELDDWNLIGQFTVEARQKVIDHLAAIDPEFTDIKFNYQLTQ